MLYDPAVQDIDSTASAIGEAVCDYFGPYDNVTRLHDLLDAASPSLTITRCRKNTTASV